MKFQSGALIPRVSLHQRSSFCSLHTHKKRPCEYTAKRQCKQAQTPWSGLPVFRTISHTLRSILLCHPTTQTQYVTVGENGENKEEKLSIFSWDFYSLDSHWYVLLIHPWKFHLFIHLIIHSRCAPSLTTAVTTYSAVTGQNGFCS
jgi:hypothetical protein